MEQIGNKTSELKTENNLLKKQLAQIVGYVRKREIIFNKKNEHHSNKIREDRIERQHKQTIDSVMTKSKLTNLVKKQSNEIENLRKKLNILRQRTFPTFTKQP